MKYVIFDAGCDQKRYKDNNVCNYTLSPRYLFGHAGFFINIRWCFYD